MKSIALGIALAAGFASVSYAADLPAKAPSYAPAPAVAAPSWSGFYIGLNGGGKGGKFSGNAVAAPVPGFPATAGGGLFPFDSSWSGGIIGGGQVGYNWQYGQWVLGIEGDIDAVNMSYNSPFGAAPGGVAGGIFIANDQLAFRNDWQASLRARGGMLWGPALFYVTGGAAWAHIQAQGAYPAAFVGAVPVPSALATDSRVKLGYTVGAGFEVPLSAFPRLSIGGEYRYSDFGTTNFNLGGIPFPAGAASVVTANTAFRTHEATIRLNYKLW